MSVAGQVSRPAARRARVRVVDIFGAVGFLLMGLSFYMDFFYAPTELIQGEPYRIVYVHVPMITLAYVTFFLVFVFSILYLWKRKVQFDIIARSAAEIGVLYTTLVIVSGGLWGLATWGTFWQWEPRLTFTFILWLIYVGYLMLRYASDDKERMARYCAVLGIIGFADVPMISLSVFFWRGLHPEPTNPPPEIGITLLVGLAAFSVVTAYLLLLKVHVDKAREKVEELRFQLEEETR